MKPLASVCAFLVVAGLTLPLVAPSQAISVPLPPPPLPVPPVVPCVFPAVDPVLCPPQAGNPEAISCLAYGILVDGRNLPLAPFEAHASRSQAFTVAIPGAPVPLPPAPWPAPVTLAPPAAPQAHADAEQAGFDLGPTLFGITVSSSTVYSQCDLVHTDSFGPGYVAYGRGGVQDLLVNPGALVQAKALDFQVDAQGPTPAPPGVIQMECHELQAMLAAGAIGLDVCPAAVYGNGLVVASVYLNEQWGPVVVGPKEVYGGAALHIQVGGAAFGLALLDIYVGYAAVAVPGPNAGPIDVPPGLPPGVCPGLQVCVN